MFARRNGDSFDLCNDDGSALTIAPDAWPLIWPNGSDVSARYEHPAGITLNAQEYAKVAVLVPLE